MTSILTAAAIVSACSMTGLVCFAIGHRVGVLTERHRDWYGNVRGDGERWDGIDDSMKVPREWL